MKFILSLLCITFSFVSCSKSSSTQEEASNSSLFGFSESEKIQIVYALLSPNGFDPKKKVEKDVCMLNYFKVDGSRDGDIVEANISYDMAAGTLLLLSGGRTNDKKYCDELAKEYSKLTDKDKKQMTEKIKINMSTGKKIITALQK